MHSQKIKKCLNVSSQSLNMGVEYKSYHAHGELNGTMENYPNKNVQTTCNYVFMCHWRLPCKVCLQGMHAKHAGLKQ